MRIAIVGFGNVGSSLAKVWTAANHEVYVGVRSPETSKPNSNNIKPVTVNEAAASANIVALAIPWTAVRDTLEACGNLSGKIIIDCTNPLNKDLSGLEIGTTTSSAEQIAALRPEAHVIKAFNTLEHFSKRCRPKRGTFARLSIKESRSSPSLESSQHFGKCFRCGSVRKHILPGRQGQRLLLRQ